MAAKTQLFDGSDFETAVAVYWRVLEEARKVVGPVPNHDASWVHQRREGTSFHRWVVERREEIRARDGFLLEEFPFLGFIIKKGNSVNEFQLMREKLFPQSWAPFECVAQITCSAAKNAADVAEAVLGFAMQVELNALVPAAADYEVSVKDVTKIGGYDRHATSMAQAMVIKRSLEDMLFARERGNVVTEAEVTVNGIGRIVFTSYGQPRFIPNPEHRPEPISEERFAEIVAAYATKQARIRVLWGFIVSKHSQKEFGFNGTTYVMSANPSSGAPEWCNIYRHYVGSLSGVSLFEALDSGLLEAWARSLGYTE